MEQKETCICQNAVLKMKRKTFAFTALLVIFCLSIPVQAQTDYDGWMQKARDILNDPVADKTGINQTWQLGLNKVRAADALVEAAKLAPDETKKFDAYFQAGDLFRSESKSEGAAKAYAAARDIKAGPIDKRAEAGYYAAVNFQQFDFGRGKGKQVPAEVFAEYEKALAIVGAPPATQVKILEKYAYYLERQERLWESAQHSRKAAELTPPSFEKMPSEQDMHYYRAASNAAKLPPTAETRAFVENIFKAQLKARQTFYAGKPKELSLSESMLKDSHAKRILAMGVPERAFTLWTEIGSDTNRDRVQRYQSFKLMAEEQKKLKLWPSVIKTWDTAVKIPDLPWMWVKESTEGKAEGYGEQNDFKNARLQYEELLNSPQCTESEKSQFKFALGKYYVQENTFLLPTKPALATPARNEAEKIFSALLANPTTNYNIQLDSVKQLAQLELNSKNTDGAIRQLEQELSRFDKAHPAFGKHILNTIARIYLSQGKYTETLASLQRSSENSKIPGFIGLDSEGRQIALSAHTQASKAKNWAEAEKIVSSMEKWIWDKTEILFLRLQNAVETKNFAAARTYVNEIGLITYLSVNNKKKLEEWKNKIPVE
jgi:hypothetical protein